MPRNFYEVLGVDKASGPEEITKAYRKLSKQYHPDRNPGDDDALAKYREVQEAHETLSDPHRRSAYDLPNSQQRFNRGRRPPPNPGYHFNEVMEEFFGGSISRGRNIQIRVEVDLNEVMTGCTKLVKVKKRSRCVKCTGKGYSSSTVCQPCNGTGFKITTDAPFMVQTVCPDCEGKGVTKTVRCVDCLGAGFTPMQDKSLNVKIPGGIGHGMSIRIAGEGEEPQKAHGIPGDVLVVVLIKEHNIFRREGFDLVVDIPVSYTQVALGAKIDIPTLGGDKVEVQIPAGSQTNTKFRLKGRGLPDMRGSTGDILATVKVETPKTPDDEYKKVLEQLAELESKVVTPRREGWAKKVAQPSK